MKREYITTYGYCPVLKKEHNVIIEYAQPPGTQGFKALSCECSNADNCPLNLCQIMMDNAYFLQR